MGHGVGQVYAVAVQDVVIALLAMEQSGSRKPVAAPIRCLLVLW
jgi:hypothetical protein